MIEPWRIRRALHNQLDNARRWLRREPVQVTPLGSATLDQDDVAIARQCLRQDPQQWLDEAPVRQFEREFARWNGSRNAFSFRAGRVALSACIEALELGPGDECIVPGYTCIVVPNALDYAGVKPVYCDIELDTYGLDAARLEAAVSPHTKAILIQHLYGLVCRDYEAILAFAEARGLPVIEDCAHATGALFKDRKVGNRGAVGFYSLEQSKVITTIQGGVVVCQDEDIARRLKACQQRRAFPDADYTDRLLNNVILNYYNNKHGMRWLLGDVFDCVLGDKYLVSTPHSEVEGRKPGYYDTRMSAPVAHLGLNQLGKIDDYNERRRSGAGTWDRWCDDNGYTRPTVIPDSQPIFLRYPVLVDPALKEDTSWIRRDLGVEPGVWFTSNLHPMTGVLGECPNANIAVQRCINFPTLLDRE